MIQSRLSLLVLVLLILAAVVIPAEAQELSAAGRWSGEIEIPGAPLGVEVELSEAAGGWAGRISIPAQMAKDLPLEGIEVNDARVRFAIVGVPGAPTFTGTLADDGSKISGIFTQGGQRFPFTLERPAAHAKQAQQALDGFAAFVDQARAAWDVPGLAMAIVKDGQVIFSQGFGFRDRETELPVTADTLFAIGSSTKAFTTFVLGTLVDEGKLAWDEPVRNTIPRFRMYSDETTLMITPRDLVTHRSGLPRHDMVWYNDLGASRADLVSRLAYLEPSAQLRQKWQYNNLMFVTAGYLAEVVTGSTWEDAVRTRIFAPIGMTRSNFSVHVSEADPDHALPYRMDKDEVERIPFREITTIGPAGSINSSAADMTRWLLVQTGDGTIDGHRVIQAGTLAEIHAPQMVTGATRREPQITPADYGMGWFIDGYRGQRRVSHGGNIDGFSALVSMLPDDGIGMVVLTNLDATGLPEILVRHATDRLLGLEPIDWNAAALARRAQGKEVSEEAEQKKETLRRPGTKPAHPVEEYIGEYTNLGYGTIAVSSPGDGTLKVAFHGLEAPLEHWHYEVFRAGKNHDDPALEDTLMEFRTNLEGYVSELEVPFEPAVDAIVFAKRPPVRLSDPTYLATLAGEYELGGVTLTVTLQGSTLILTVPGQPRYELEPTVSGGFQLKQASVVGLHFIEHDGVVTGVELQQPSGVATATRKR